MFSGSHHVHDTQNTTILVIQFIFQESGTMSPQNPIPYGKSLIEKILF